MKNASPVDAHISNTGCRNNLILDLNGLKPLTGDESLSFILRQLKIQSGALICVKNHHVHTGFSFYGNPKFTTFTSGSIYHIETRSKTLTINDKKLTPGDRKSLMGDRSLESFESGGTTFYRKLSVMLNGVDLLKLDLSNFAILCVYDTNNVKLR